MKRPSAVLLLLAVAPLSAIAGPATTARVLSCANPNWPTRLQVAHYLAAPRVIVGEDASSPSQPDFERAQALAQAEQVVLHVRSKGRQECWRGATQLLVTFHPPLQRNAPSDSVAEDDVADAGMVAVEAFAAAP